MNPLSLKSLKVAGLCFLLTLSAACTHDHRVHIQPELFVRESGLGKGATIKVEVVDRRAQRAIYQKSAGPSIPLAGGSLNQVNIYPTGSVDDPIEDQIRKGLVNLGFDPVEDNRKYQRLLRVEVLHLRMHYSFEDPKLKIPEKNVRLRTALGVTAQRPDQTLKRLYETALDKSQNLLTGEFKNEQFINNAISLTLQKMFEDEALLRFLSPEN